MSNIGSYESRLENFDWKIAEEVLDWKDGELLNIGHMCSTASANAATAPGPR